MDNTDIAIIGAGLAGSLSAGMLQKRGINHKLIDPRLEYPDEFRCEKFNAQQIAMLEETGLAEKVLQDLTPVKDVWMARFGRLLRKQTYPHFGFSYNEAVNSIRRHHLKPENFLQNTVKSIETSTGRQTLTMSDGTTLSAKLVVLATGANANIQKQLGMTQDMVSERHCLAIGFDLMPKNDFDFDTMTFWPEAASGKMSYLTLFRTSGGWRANLFGYWSLKADEITELRSNPTQCLHNMMPNLAKIAGKFEVTGKLRVRPINLYQWQADNIDGVVSIGDAWSSSCPGAGTGTTKAINDALQLSQKHIPEWISEPTIDAKLLSKFYNDAEKLAIDQYSINQAYKLRNVTLSNSPYWMAQRWMRFLYHGARGKLATG